MEPAAPGTEDEVLDFNSLNKKETENDRLLNIKAVLKNGKFENVFELSYIKGGEQWFCKICECPIMGRVYQHELGRRHSQNMQSIYNRGRSGMEVEETEHVPAQSTTLGITPGEPVPPGIEDVSRKAVIQDRLDGFKVGPLVALEYLIEMADYDPSKEPTYLCILCDKKGDPRTVLTHLASYNHISQYLQKHFPTCYRALAPYMTKQFKRNWQLVLQKIAEAIEKKHGRLRPFCIDQDKFEKERMYFLTMISRGLHFSEQNGPNFLELIVHEELTKTFDDEGRPVVKSASSFGGKSFIARDPVRVVKKRSPSPPVVAKPGKKTRNLAEEARKPDLNRRGPSGIAKPRRRSLSSVSSLSSNDDNSQGRRLARNRSPPLRGSKRPFDNRVAYRRRSPSPRKRALRGENEERYKNREKEERQKIDEYNKLSKAIETDVEKGLKQHEKNPERHPKYSEEWKLFWNKRYKELQSEGKDASKYDFKPEWIQFWGKRMKELSEEEIKNRKEGLRKRLGLVEEAPPVSFKIGGASTGSTSYPPKLVLHLKDSKSVAPSSFKPTVDPDIIIVDDKSDSYQPPPRKPILNRDAQRSHSPWESDPSPPRSASRRRSRSPGLDRRRSGFKNSDRSRDRSIDRRRGDRSPDRRRSSERATRSPDRTRRSSERSRRSSERIRRSPERNRRSPERTRRSQERNRTERNRRSLEGGRRSPRGSSISRDRRSRSPEFGREREREREHVREREREIGLDIIPPDRSWERGIRESSFERDVRGKDRIRTVAELPWEREKAIYGHGSARMNPMDSFYGPPPKMRDHRQMLNFIPPPVVEEEIDDGEVNIVGVLRLLTALEEKLGSLGPKIIDLLAQALALEKKEANSSETLLDNEINCVMFETVKEKLKGQLLAGLVDLHQERAFKRAIQKIASLIHIASERKRNRNVPALSAVAVPGVGAVDKAAIAKQLANALIAQGKTNVTQAELEQLINAVVGMAEASKGSNKPMTAASFLAKLTGCGETATSEIEKEKVIIPRVSRHSDEKWDKPRESDMITPLEAMTEPLSPEPSSTNNMENLSDSDLQTLLQNFKDLSTEEQMNLINYLKKLELDEPERVERLRKFVNLGGEQSRDIIDIDREPSPNTNGRKSPFSIRVEDTNPQADSFRRKNRDDKVIKIHLDSEDEDYSYEDVVKAVSKNVQQKELINNRQESSVTDAKTLISNLMSSFGGKTTSAVNLLGLTPPASTSHTITTPAASADFANALRGINMDNLANIVSSVKRASQEKKLNFDPPSTSLNALTATSVEERFVSAELNPGHQVVTVTQNVQLVPPIEHKTALHFDAPQISSPSTPLAVPPVGQRMPLLLSTSNRFGLPRNMGPVGPPGPRGAARPMGPGRVMGPGGPMGSNMSMRPRAGLGPPGFPQRGPNPNFGNPNFMNPRLPRPQFTQRYSGPAGPRGPGFNRW